MVIKTAKTLAGIQPILFFMRIPLLHPSGAFVSRPVSTREEIRTGN
ncbi:hypothetical protein LptCag_0403 [Leptospirillum ferriphilum]|uniref:Uncharacterized protein n=1 Tax=Leptospirillum ferriphilum TaxID=178606 RepID=A0A094WCH6_9BACT|nr:hypothetical protein LptCag_0403 [Leptospirillum ferriphilum]